MQENTKSVVVKMTARRCFRTEPIYQYDVGHVLAFEGFELPTAFEVHFARSPLGKAVTQIGTDGTCTLPDMFAQTAGVIYAWLYIADADSGLTKYSIEIPVAKRAQITDQEPTPVEQSAIDQAIAALNAGVERSETAADAAESAQEAAEGYAESAGNSAITATNAATAAGSAQTAAETAARNAAASATDAHTSREAADQSATNAGVSERNAAASASAAAGSATSAATSAGQASASATAASGSASTASTKASEAAQSATAAAGSAASASEDAGTASTAATAAGQSATAAAGSATAAAGSATSAGQSATAAAGSAQAAQDVLDSIPADYSELSGEVDTLLSALKHNVNQVADTLNDPVLSDITWIDNKYVNSTTNQITNGGNTLHITDYILVPSSTYKIRTNAKGVSLAWTLAFYNDAKEFISGVKAAISGYNEYTDIPAGTAYVIVTHLSDQAATSTVGIELYINQRIDDAETDLSILQGKIAGLEEKTIAPDFDWTTQKRLDVNGNVINASTAFALSQAFDVANDDFYKIRIEGLNGISDGSTISIQAANTTVLQRTAQNGTFEILKSELPEGAAILYVCQYITTSTPLSGVVMTKQYFKRIVDIENDLTSVEDTTEKLSEMLTFDESYRNVLSGASTFTDAKFINDQGNIVNNSNFCLIDGFFPVKPNTNYRVYRDEPAKYSNAGHNWTFWDANKTFISGSYVLSGGTVTSPANAAYLRLAIYISNTGSATHENFDPADVKVTEDYKPVFENPYADTFVGRPSFNGKKWIAIGDSITEANFRAQFHYWDYICAETGLNVVNMGVSGTGYKAEGSGDKAFYKRVPSMATDADIITIFGGVNDVVLSNSDIGTATDSTTDTICGCVNQTLDIIEGLYPAHMPIGIISPLPCACVDTTVNLHPVQNPADDTCRMTLFVEQLALICKHRGIPFLDLFHQSNLRPWHQECNAKYFSCDSAPTGDGLHPNGHGHRLIYRQILEFMKGFVTD